MIEQVPVTKHLFYLAPLQGFTDYTFREAYSNAFDRPDACFSPFIETHKPDHRVFRDVLPERNTSCHLIPQILGNDAQEMEIIIHQLQSMGYEEVNINLGCPYPMVTRKLMGAGLLPHPDKIDEILARLFNITNCHISVKMRLGMSSTDEWKGLVPVLNRYPLSEVIIHGRTASQMYKGGVDVQAFAEFAGQLEHPVCYNGNIFTLEEWNQLRDTLPSINQWMLGRGLISNPLLLHEIKTNQKAGDKERLFALNALHDQLLTLNTKRLSGPSHILNKMKPYWEYFAASLIGREKGLKKIKKAANMDAYLMACGEVFR